MFMLSCMPSTRGKFEDLLIRYILCIILMLPYREVGTVLQNDNRCNVRVRVSLNIHSFIHSFCPAELIVLTDENY